MIFRARRNKIQLPVFSNRQDTVSPNSRQESTEKRNLSHYGEWMMMWKQHSSSESKDSAATSTKEKSPNEVHKEFKEPKKETESTSIIGE